MATRRSTRIVNSAVEGPSEPKDESYQSDPDDQSEDDVPKRKKTRTGGKRKAAESSGPSGQMPAHKKQRGSRGLLKDVVDMPLDVVLEIFGKLSPGDLLNLAQTSKDLRTILMSRSSASTWKEARENEPGLPDCPPDLSEPQYANLCFGKYCMHCMRNRVSVTYTLWSGRVRLCRSCVDTECQNYYPHYRRIYSADIHTFLPMIAIRKPGRSGRHIEYYLKSAVDDWVNRTENKSAEEKLEVKNEFKARHEHGLACNAWFLKRREALIDQKASVIDERRDLIVDYARSLGWDDEFELSHHALEHIKRSDVIRKACSKNVTEKVLTNLEDTLNEILRISKSKRLADAAGTLLRKRLPIYKDAFKQCLNTLSAIQPHPTPRQLFETPLIRDIIVNTPATQELTIADFQPLTDNFATLVDDWKAQMQSNLKDMIRKAQGTDSDIDNEKILELATTFFMCKRCGSTIIEPISYPRVLSHNCNTAPSYSSPSLLSVAQEAEDSALRSVLVEARWNQHTHLSFNTDFSRFMGDIVEVCGFDRRTTTKAEMDAANPIIECLTCHTDTQGRAVMTWWNTIHHWRGKHSNKYIMSGEFGQPSTMTVRLVDDPKDADRIRAELAIQREKDDARLSSSICAQCHFKQSHAQCKKHWKTEHKRPAKEGDILPQLDHRHFKDDYYCWPPWEDEEFTLLSGTDIAVVKGGVPATTGD